MAPTLEQNLNEIDFEAKRTHAMVECHPDIFKSDFLKVPKLPFQEKV